jgi:peptidoglycan/LPS O-acetylase OafA/YrhL
MNFVHIHLAINHSPLYATLFAFFFVLIGMIIRNRSIVTAGLIITIVAALCAIAADATGDQASDIIDHSPPIAGVDKLMIAPHDEAATWFLTASCITGGAALIVLFIGRKRGERPRWMEVVMLFLLVFCLATVARTALLGGRIHHPEVRAVVPG